MGGTFDPPHKGHFYISKIALKKLHLKYLFWIVTKQNPLKSRPILETNIRIKLSKNITQNQKKFPCIIWIKKLSLKIH